ncbi:MAG TPA: ABC transporter substrate-binding protein [Alphaproteobacteria bacterium]|jgi:ABC-type branched-subunit amino acid transport system substrate-binding protein
MMQKKFIGSALAAALVALGATTEPTRAQGQSGPWIVAAIAPTTGAAASVGVRQLAVLRWWVEELNKAGGIKGKTIEFTVCNEENNPEKAVACARDVLAKKPVGLVLSTLTASTRAVLPLLKDGPITTLPGPNVIPPPDSYAFQTSVTPDDLHSGIGQALQAGGFKKFGFIAATDASGEVNVESANRLFPKMGIQLVVQRIDLRATDASAQLARMAGEDVPLIYSTYSGRGASTVVKSYYNLGLDKPFMVNFANTSEAFIAEIKDVMPKRLLGITFRGSVPPLVEDAEDRKRAAAFKETYEKQFKEHIDEFAVLGKFQADLIEAVMRNVADPHDVKAAKRYLEINPVRSVQTLRFSAQSHTALGPKDVVVVEYKPGKGWQPADSLKK